MLFRSGVNLLPIWFFWDTYYDFALASGMEQSYIDSYVRYYTSPSWLALDVYKRQLLKSISVGMVSMPKRWMSCGSSS